MERNQTDAKEIKKKAIAVMETKTDNYLNWNWLWGKKIDGLKNEQE